ncbi:hypothetical protein FR483_N189L [Paramecium bursaria Chlorella virus FR483]|uniref:Uncharacterized protein N189L n=1 Tax=Paramecium bursaria Chlorella virus FR483 TaxID=399781 RepID=A7J6P3_PBCVF|nr:hypothetical protein FR483_N189L [Paramecium bursaria Chlorella virus FR483]ABT15474.1 hypothetical protein FR483_N189L [Paramecium bursaria Chlorella virus FR483]
MSTHLVITLAILVFIALVAAFFVIRRRENFSEYPGNNDFMKIYYDQVAEDPKFVKKFPYWGTGAKAGLRCRKPNNIGCNTIWLSGHLVEITPEVKKNLECKYGLPFNKILTNIS